MPTGGAKHVKVGASPPAAKEDGALALAHLLRVEAEARRATTTRELDALFANEGRKLLRARQIAVVVLSNSGAHVASMPGVANVDRTVPMVRWIESTVAGLGTERGLQQPVAFELPGYAPEDDPLTRDFPFRFMLWQPMWSPRGKSVAGALVMRESHWSDADRKIAVRLAETFGHARALIEAGLGRQKPAGRYRRLWPLALLMLALAGAIPVPISVLAPLEIVPRNAEIVAMPLEGIVNKVLVQPNEAVDIGAPLVQLVDTIARNRAHVAEQEVALAAVRLEKASSLAFTDARGRQELGVARADLALKKAEATYARELLAQTLIKAEAAGIAVFSDRRDLEGKPMSVGTRLMLIARPGESEIRISLPVTDSIVLRPGLKVNAYLDADPLSALEAEIAHVDYKARVDELQTAVYTVTARIRTPVPHLSFGARGTAQILGERVPLALYVFRKPLTALRQRLGL